MTKCDLAKAIGGIARVMARDSRAHTDLVDGFLILTESLVEVSSPPSTRKQERVERLARVERGMVGRTSAERRKAVMDDLQIKESYYYEIRSAAIEQRLIHG